MELFDIYNKYGEKTGETIERNEAHKNRILHRVIHLWILNQNNEILIQQRSPSIPGGNLWYVSVAGHIESSENIENTLIREAQEELGLNISNITHSIKYLYTFLDCIRMNSDYIDNEIYDVFVLKADFDLRQVVVQAEEVQAVKYIKYADFKDMIIKQDKSLWQHKVGNKMLLIALDDFLGIT